MDPVKTYDYLVLARAKVLAWCRPLTPEQYEQIFPIGLGSLSRTIAHIAMCEWIYLQRLQGADLPPVGSWPVDDDNPPPFQTVEAFWKDLAPRTRAALAAVQDWTSPLTWRFEWDGVSRQTTAAPSDIAAQMLLHEVHHRAQALNMLRHLGVKTQDIDYNEFFWERRIV